VEIAVSRLFNGENWVGPIYINVEHKKFFPGDLGPTTSEMGTLVWCEQDDNSKLFAETLSCLKPHLQKIKYRGMIDLNCIVDETGAYPLEASPRFGSPIVYAQTELNKSPWGDILKAVADGNNYDLKTQKGYGIVVLVTVPPFPYTKKLKQLSPKGLNIYFSDNVTEKSFSHIHFEGVALRKNAGKAQYYISDDQGYILYLSAVGHSVETAQKKVYSLAKDIYIPKMFYRNDIGNRFLQSSYDDLRRWGYL
jgi:phosphoribosylamine--glycine ligase